MHDNIILFDILASNSVVDGYSGCSLVEKNYTLSLVVVPKGYGGHTMPSSGIAVCDG